MIAPGATAVASSSQPQQDRPRVPVVLAERASNHAPAAKASGSTSRPGAASDAPYLLPRTPQESQQRRASDGRAPDTGSRNPASSFSHVGASLFDAANITNVAHVRQSGADLEASSRIFGTGAPSSASATPANVHRVQNGEFIQGTPITGDHPRMGGASVTGQQRGLFNVIAPEESPDELGGMDDSPACVIDCGATANGFVGSETPPPSGAGAGEWTDPRTEPAQGGRPFLLPFAVRQEGGRPLWPTQPLGAGELGAQRPAERTQEPPAAVPTTSGDTVRQEREAMMQTVMEFGFSEYQATEAFKRCSTVEGAVEWITDPGREWAESWS